MLQAHDIRESRVYQEAREEGLKKGVEKGRQEALKMAIAMFAAKKKMSAAEIASILEIDEDKVRQALNGANGK